jgi:phage-related protein (TIGR01555 family)
MNTETKAQRNGRAGGRRTQAKRKLDELRSENIARAVAHLKAISAPAKNYNYEIKPPVLMPGVVPGETRPLIAMDSGAFGAAYEYSRQLMAFGAAGWVGFPGYPYLAGLSTRPEYRNFAQALGTQLTREWIEIASTETAGSETKEKCKELEQMCTDIQLKECVNLMAEHDSYYGRGQMFLNLSSQDRSTPLVLSPKTIQKRTLKDGVSFEKYFRISAVEALWTTPNAYNAIDPGAPDFYKPTAWWMLGQQVHASRLQTVITREVSDMLKPAYNFGGISMSQLAEPYVDNWLRTRQSVANLISNFSIVTLSTAMDQLLQGNDNGETLTKRAEYFNLTRDNQGIFLLDKDREDLDMHNAPLGGLAELQAQSQEQMCSVSHTPAVILLGIAPSGFGNVAEGEIRSFYDWIAAQQENYWRKPIITVINILQLIRYGKIDPDIVVNFQPLYQMTPKELAEIRKSDGDLAASLLDRSVIDATEERERLARSPSSGYQGIDTTKVPVAEGNDDPDENPSQLEQGDVP